MIIIDNNFLSKEEISEVDSTILSERNYWNFHRSKDYFQKDIDDRSVTIENNIFKSSSYFTNVFYLDSENFPYINSNPDMKNISEKILNKFAIKNNIEIEKIIRIRSNINTKNNEDVITPPHVDQTDNHFVFLYYINTSDGDTVIYNQKYNGSIIDFFDEKMRITPISGTAVVFDGLLYHSICPPKKSMYRSVINIDFYGKIKV